MTQFENRYRQPGETLPKFSDELLLLVRKAYPYLDDNTQNHIALQQWYKSFCPEVRWRCQERNCGWIREAEEIADLYEAIMQPKERKRNVNLIQQDQEHKETDFVQPNEKWRNVGLVQRNEERQKLSNGHTSDRNPRFTTRCYCCQDTTHILKDCPVFESALKGGNEIKPQLPERKCFACGESNHFQRDCPIFMKFKELQVKGAFGRRDHGNISQGN
jgi:hypothetical protein